MTIIIFGGMYSLVEWGVILDQWFRSVITLNACSLRVLAEQELKTNIVETEVFVLPSGQQIEKGYFVMSLFVHLLAQYGTKLYNCVAFLHTQVCVEILVEHYASTAVYFIFMSKTYSCRS